MGGKGDGPSARSGRGDGESHAVPALQPPHVGGLEVGVEWWGWGVKHLWGVGEGPVDHYI